MNSLSVITYNIWFDETHRETRLKTLIETIKENKPDIICYQEVSAIIYDKLRLLHDEYKYVYPKEMKHTYGCMIISKYEIKDIINIEYNKTNMFRNLIGIKIVLDNNNIIIATSHFESVFNKNTIKIKQYEQAKYILDELYKKGNHIIFCADTNIMQNEEYYYFNDNQWLETFNGNNNDNYTYDADFNIHLQKKNKAYKSRLDRIIYKSNSLIASEYKLLNKYDTDRMQPSDHFGIYVNFTILNTDILI
jgi:tyrosyl-DNA phosphodiesterase 2